MAQRTVDLVERNALEKTRLDSISIQLEPPMRKDISGKPVSVEVLDRIQLPEKEIYQGQGNVATLPIGYVGTKPVFIERDKPARDNPNTTPEEEEASFLSKNKLYFIIGGAALIGFVLISVLTKKRK